MFQIPVAPRDENWPMASSIKNNGRPLAANIIVYGIKKAPRNEI